MRSAEAEGYLDCADVLLAELLQRVDDLLVRAPQLQHTTLAKTTHPARRTNIAIHHIIIY